MLCMCGFITIFLVSRTFRVLRKKSLGSRNITKVAPFTPNDSEIPNLINCWERVSGVCSRGMLENSSENMSLMLERMFTTIDSVDYRYSVFWGGLSTHVLVSRTSR